MFAQVCIAMAHHGYLGLEGGQLMVEFIVRQCTLPDDPPVGTVKYLEFVVNSSDFYNYCLCFCVVLSG